MSSLTRHVYAPTANVNRFTSPVPVNKGGTGANNAVTAVENLGGIPKSKANLPNGWGQLDGDGKLPASVFPLEASGGPTIDGPDQLLIQKTGVFTITNYDSNEVYTITAAQGIVSRNGDTIYYTAPALEGAYGFVINGKAVSVNISAHYVSQPSIISPANTEAAISNVVLINSLYADDRAIGDYFGVSVAVAGDGQRIAVGTGLKTVNGVATAGQVSIYTRSGNTWVLESTISAADKVADDRFGFSIALTYNGDRIAIGAYRADPGAVNNAGKVYVYTRSGSNWVLETIISAADKVAVDGFGTAVSFDSQGNYLAIGAVHKTVSTIVEAGQVYIYTRSGTTWTQESVLSASDKVNPTQFGSSLSLSADGQQLVVGAIAKSVSSLASAGQVYVYTKSGISWVEQAKLSASDKAANDNFGSAVSLSLDGTRIAVGASSKQITNTFKSGKVYTYIKTSNGWIEEFSFTCSVNDYNSSFGYSLAFNSNTEILIGAISADSENVPNCGAVYTYALEYSNASKNRQQSLVNFTSSAFDLTGQYLESTLTASDAATSDWFGFGVAVSGDGTRLAVGAIQKDVSGTADAGQVYVYMRSGSTWIQEAIITASDKAASDWFGTSLAFDSSGSRLVIGAENKTVSALSQAGKVYVYTRSGSVWTEESTLTASDKAASDRFGISVALSAAGDRLAVGAFGKTVSGITNAGQVYVYTRVGSTWSLETTITASDKATNDAYGRSVAFDSNGSRLAVGAYSKTITALTNAGQVYVYTRSGSVWTEEAKITASDKATGDLFGQAVSLVGDGSRLFISAQGKTINGVTQAGKVYGFSRSGSIWSLESSISNPIPETGDAFGAGLAVVADGTRLIISSTGKDISANLHSVGNVFTYLMSYHEGSDWQLATDPGFTNIIKSVTNSATNKTSWQVTDLEAGTDYYARCRHKGTTYGYSDWSPTCKLTTSDTFVPYFETTILAGSDKASGDSYGIAAALSNDGSRLAIGAYQKTVSAVTAAGQVYVYTRSGTTWTEEAQITASDKVASDYFGVSVAFDGNANRLAIGAHGKDVSGISNAGQVYVYTRSGSTWSIETTITASDKALNDYFGIAVAFDSVGSRLAVGAYGKDVSGIVDAGKVYVYTRTGSVYTQETTITASDKATNDLFGAGLSMNDDGSLLLVGAATKTVGGLSQAGQVYLLSRVGSTWTEIATLTAADKAANDRFGFGLAISRDSKTVVIGAYNKTVTAATMGKVYYYQLNGNTFTQVTSAAASDKVTGDLFGASVALSDDASIMAVGASSRDSDGVLNSGGAYIFY